MGSLALSIQGSGLAKFTKATRVLGSEGKARAAYRMGINKTGRKAFTSVKRAVSKQVGLTQKNTIRYGGISRTFASASNLSFVIDSRGGEVPLKHFKARETAKGVSAAPMGKRQIFEHTFIKGGLWPKRTGLVAQGHVFTPGRSNRWGRSFTRTRSGVSIPEQIVKDESRKAWNTATAGLDNHIEQIIRKMTRGVIS